MSKFYTYDDKGQALSGHLTMAGAIAHAPLLVYIKTGQRKYSIEYEHEKSVTVMQGAKLLYRIGLAELHSPTQPIWCEKGAYNKNESRALSAVIFRGTPNYMGWYKCAPHVYSLLKVPSGWVAKLDDLDKFDFAVLLIDATDTVVQAKHAPLGLLQKENAANMHGGLVQALQVITPQLCVGTELPPAVSIVLVQRLATGLHSVAKRPMDEAFKRTIAETAANPKPVAKKKKSGAELFEEMQAAINEK